jgi:hypothetical protein
LWCLSVVEAASIAIVETTVFIRVTVGVLAVRFLGRTLFLLLLRLWHLFVAVNVTCQATLSVAGALGGRLGVYTPTHVVYCLLKC